MATIEDLSHKSILEMTRDEAIEYIRQVRLSRRTTKATTRKASTTKASKKPIPKLTKDDAAELLKLLGGN